jgi:hypothetical protein
MELIVEIIDQAGRAHDRRRFSGDRFTIGRAFDNDLILTDSTVNPHHAVIEKSGDGRILVKDLDSLNGVYVKRKQRLHGSAELVSGTEYRIGKTRVYVYTPDHPVNDTIRFGNAEHVIEWFDSPYVLLAAALAVALIYGVQQWLNMFSGFEWEEIANIMLIVFGSATSLTLFWVVIGRVLKHEANFRKQAAITLLFVAAQFVLSRIFNFVLYNTLDYTVSIGLLVVIEFILVCVMLWLNLFIATNLSSGQRIKTAATMSAVLIALSLYSEVPFTDDFSPAPEYIRVIRPPVFLVAGGVSEDEFVAGAAQVFTRLDAETAEDTEDAQVR